MSCGLSETYEVFLYHGPRNNLHTIATYTADSAADAAGKFIAEYFPGERIYLPLRIEQPKEINGVLYRNFSVGNTASGQRIWIKLRYVG